MSQKADIHKAAAIIIQDRKVLLERSEHKVHFIEPGGKIERGETPRQGLIRELKEELEIKVKADDLEPIGIFYDAAAGQEHLIVKLEVFLVKKWTGKISASMEVEELLWVSSDIPKDIKVGSIFEREILPYLTKQGLID